MKQRRPIIGLPACIKTLEEHPFHAVGAKYVNAVVNAINGIPLLLPAVGEQQDIDAILDMVDGILLTGSASNVAPALYGKTLNFPAEYLDAARDASTLPLIRATVAANIPILGICRGFQELNVAFGGTLHQAVHDQGSFMDHREQPGSLDVQYGPAHQVHLNTHGYLHQLFNGENNIMVNSIHGQGIDTLGNNLLVEATAPDGLIEAIRVENAQNFALAVQWHPEWKTAENAYSTALFKAFSEACRASK